MFHGALWKQRDPGTNKRAFYRITNICVPSGLPAASYARHIAAIVLGPSISHRLLCYDTCMGVLMENEAIKESPQTSEGWPHSDATGL